MAWAKHQRRWYGKWHVYFGILAGFIVSIVSVTGSLLVFRDEIDGRLNPAFYNVSSAGPYLEYNDVVPLIRSRYPDIQIRSIRKAEEKNGGPYIVASGQKELFFDPYTGKKLGERYSGTHFIAIVLKIHRFLCIPYAGRYIVGASTLGLLILIITGLRLWLPKKLDQLRSRLSVRWKAGLKRQAYDWHNVIGVVASPVLVVLAITGLCMTLNLTSMPLVFVLNGESPAKLLPVILPRSVPQPATEAVTLSGVMDTVRAVLGNEAVVTQLGLPGKDTADAYRMQATIPSKRLVPGRKVLLSVDRYSGAVLADTESSLPIAGHIYFTWLQSMHYGHIGGITTRVLTFIGGLIPFFMFLTGWIIWRPRYRKYLGGREKEREVMAGTPIPGKSKAVSRMLPESFRQGLKYAGIFIVVLLAMGLAYGLVARHPLQVMIACVVFTSYVVISNFIFALLVLLIYMFFFLPFRKFRRNAQAIVRYCSQSAAFFLVFVLLYLALMRIEWTIF